MNPHSPSANPAREPQYWRGLDQLADTPEFRRRLEAEFQPGDSELTDPVSRRQFAQLMSASFLLAGLGLTGCRRPEEKILPFARQPEHYTHGVPQYYATAMPARGGALPLVVKAHDGRPVKIEGNPLHPDSNGGTDRFAQASLLDLYDPDRARRFAHQGRTVPREAALDFLATLAQAARANSGAGLAFLLEPDSSPSRARLEKLLQTQLPRARWFTHDPMDTGVARQAAQLVCGRPVAAHYHLDRALRIVALDCDFLGAEPDCHRFIRDFARGRRLEKPDAARGEDLMSRLYAVEGVLTLTGANADHRLRVPHGAVVQVAAALAAQVVKQPLGDFAAVVQRLGPPPGVNPEWITECARDLLAHPGQCLVLAGHRQPLAVHLLAWVMNHALGNVGRTVECFDVSANTPAEGGLVELAAALRAGQVETLVILDGNPAYTAPADLDWPAVQRRAQTVVRLGYHEDETFAGCDWHLPRAHYLESWGDARTSDGTLVPIQPLIAPLFDGLTELEVLARVGGLQPVSPYEIVRATFRELVPEYGFEETWKQFLHDGFLTDSAAKPVPVGLNWFGVNDALRAVSPPPAPARGQFEVVFLRDSRVDDGRYHNNGWLQELPDPITKITWENVMLISPQTARDLGVRLEDQQSNDLGQSLVPWARLELAGRAVEGPVWIQPGMADRVIGLPLGYGRTHTGRIGRGSGFNAYAVRTTPAPFIAAGATLTIQPGRKHPISVTQSHWAMQGRPIIREANLARYQQQPDFARALDFEKPPGPRDAQGRPLPLYPNPLDQMAAKGLHQWGMSIDLNACVGCSACILACQSENNVPIVGKDQVGRGREMHWLRVDRYYAGPVEDPQVVMQPMMCVHCEAAPCESVCPVNATVHDEEGLNLMVYNRCVGTRYCSNNCPYKVRRFNFFDYVRRPLDKLYRSPVVDRNSGKWELRRWWENPDRGSRPDDEWELLKLARNPEVTVRMRGVMEKCTFCIQRIAAAKIAQKVKARASDDVEVPDGTFTTACAQACPAGAIVFGNLADPNSRVSQLKKQERDYAVLEFLLTKPRLTYLARVRNPNPRMPDYHEAPASLQEYAAKHGNPFAAGHGGPPAPGAAAPGKGGH